jgi:hypothetical protein
LSDSELGATNLQQDFPLEEAFLQIFRISSVLVIKKQREREIRYNVTVRAVSNPCPNTEKQSALLRMLSVLHLVHRIIPIKFGRTK